MTRTAQIPLFVKNKKDVALAKPYYQMDSNKQLLDEPASKRLGITSSKPKYPQYAVVSKRRDSYNTWPDYLPLQPETLADAGLVYTGTGDSVRCYFCGGGLRNWERGDNPWFEHAKWYPSCPHVLLVKGQDYVDRVAKGENPEKDLRQPKTPQTKVTNYLNTPAALSCLENGFSKDLVKAAIARYTETYGHTHFKGTDLCTIIFELEEEARQTTEEPDTATEVAVSVTGCDEDLEDSLEKLYEENRRLKDNKLCKICLDNAATIIFLPCGHMISCPQCAPALTKCPICRMAVKGFVKAHFATADSSAVT